MWLDTLLCVQMPLQHFEESALIGPLRNELKKEIRGFSAYKHLESELRAVDIMTFPQMEEFKKLYLAAAKYWKQQGQHDVAYDCVKVYLNDILHYGQVSLRQA